MNNPVDRLRAEISHHNTQWSVIMAGFDAVQQSRDGTAPFLQEANFFWLTRIAEPGWRCIVTEHVFYLVRPETSDSKYLFDGSMSNDEALRVSGADAVLASDEADEHIKKVAEAHSTIYTLGEDPQNSYYDFIENPAPERLREELAALFDEVKDCRPILSRLRAIKSDDEVKKIETAIAATATAFRAAGEVLGGSSGVVYEYEIEARMTYEIRRAGMKGHAYEPIVAGGAHALTLHYGLNDAPVPKNGLVLMDVGARYQGYAADITRTYAVGIPTERERQVHAEVRSAHEAIIELIKPGVPLKEYQQKSDQIMMDSLYRLGLLENREDAETYRKYFPHAVSHGLGIDVHESLGGFDAFQVGMILTVEPGIYIQEEGIGVRIEDDILVTVDGNRNLSGMLSTGLSPTV